MLRNIATQLDAEALTYKQGFAIYRGKKLGYVWPENTDTPWARLRSEKLEAAAKYLRDLADIKTP